MAIPENLGVALLVLLGLQLGSFGFVRFSQIELFQGAVGFGTVFVGILQAVIKGKGLGEVLDGLIVELLLQVNESVSMEEVWIIGIQGKGLFNVGKCFVKFLNMGIGKSTAVVCDGVMGV